MSITFDEVSHQNSSDDSDLFSSLEMTQFVGKGSHMVSAHCHLQLDGHGHAGDFEAARMAGVHRWPGLNAAS